MLGEQRISQATLWMSAAAILRAILALFAQVLIAKEFGAAGETDAYYVSLSLPQIVGDFLIGGTLISAFVPVFVRTWKQQGEAEAWRITNFIIAMLLLVLAGAAGIYTLFGAPIIRALAPGFDERTLAEAATLASVLAPLFVLYSFSFLGTGILQSYRHFTTSAFAGVCLPASMLVFVWAFADGWGIRSLAWGALVGASLQCGVQWVAILLGKHQVMRAWQWGHPGVGAVLRAMAPIMVGVVAVNLNTLYQNFLASRAEVGMVAALNFGRYFATLPLLLLVPLAQATFPTLSAHSAEGRTGSFETLMTTGLRMVGFVGIPVAYLLVALREPLVRLIMQRGAFTAYDAKMTADAAFFLIIGTVFFSWNQILAKSYYAKGKAWMIMMLNLLAVGVILPLNGPLLGLFGIAGLALCRAAVLAIFFLGCLYLTHRYIARLPWWRLASGWIKVGGLAVVTIGIPGRVLQWVSMPEWIRIFAAAAAGGGLFLLGSYLFRFREVKEIWGAIR